jgi:hypothetical protein
MKMYSIVRDDIGEEELFYITWNGARVVEFGHFISFEEAFEVIESVIPLGVVDESLDSIKYAHACGYHS